VYEVTLSGAAHSEVDLYAVSEVALPESALSEVDDVYDVTLSEATVGMELSLSS